MCNVMARFLEQTALAAVDSKIESLTLVECSAIQQLLIGLRLFNVMPLQLSSKTHY